MQTDDPLAWAEARIRGLTSGRTLDVGCGDGRFLASGIVGMDVDADRLRAARARSSMLVRGDAHALPFRDRSFDTAYANRVLNDAGRIDQVLAEIGRVLRPDGRLLVFTRARPAERVPPAGPPGRIAGPPGRMEGPEQDRLDRSNGQARLAAHFDRVTAELHPTDDRAAVFVAAGPRSRP